MEGKYIAIAVIWFTCGVAALRDGGAASIMSFFALLATISLTAN